MNRQKHLFVGWPHACEMVALRLGIKLMRDSIVLSEEHLIGYDPGTIVHFCYGWSQVGKTMIQTAKERGYVTIKEPS